MNTISNNTPVTFNGKIITKGHWTSYLEEAFNRHPEIQKLASYDFNIIGNMTHKKSSGKGFHYAGEDLYQLTISAEKENPSLKERIKTCLGLNKSHPLSRRFHRETSTYNIINDRINAEEIIKNLNLEI